MVTIVILLSMICAIHGWGLFVTPISLLGVHPITRTSFTYFITLQTLILGALYNRRNAKPILVFVGLASLVLVAIYDMSEHTNYHNFFAAMFFICQPIIFFLEYKEKKDPYELAKGSILLFLIVLFLAGIIPIPIFEFLSYICLILFL